MGQIFSKCFGSPSKKRGKDPAAAQVVIPAGDTPSGMAMLPNDVMMMRAFNTVSNEPVGRQSVVAVLTEEQASPAGVAGVPSKEPVMVPEGAVSPNEQALPPPAVTVLTNEPTTMPPPGMSTPPHEPMKAEGVAFSNEQIGLPPAVAVFTNESKMPTTGVAVPSGEPIKSGGVASPNEQILPPPAVIVNKNEQKVTAPPTVAKLPDGPTKIEVTAGPRERMSSPAAAIVTSEPTMPPSGAPTPLHEPIKSEGAVSPNEQALPPPEVIVLTNKPAMPPPPGAPTPPHEPMKSEVTVFSNEQTGRPPVVAVFTNESKMPTTGVAAPSHEPMESGGAFSPNEHIVPPPAVFDFTDETFEFEVGAPPNMQTLLPSAAFDFDSTYGPFGSEVGVSSNAQILPHSAVFDFTHEPFGSGVGAPPNVQILPPGAPISFTSESMMPPPRVPTFPNEQMKFEVAALPSELLSPPPVVTVATGEPTMPPSAVATSPHEPGKSKSSAPPNRRFLPLPRRPIGPRRAVAAAASKPTIPPPVVAPRPHEPTKSGLASANRPIVPLPRKWIGRRPAVATVASEPTMPSPVVAAPPREPTKFVVASPNEQSPPPPAVTTFTSESKMASAGVTALPKEPSTLSSQTDSPAPKTIVTSPGDRHAQLLDRVRALSDYYLNRDFWEEAVETLPEEYKIPEEWRAATVDRESFIDAIRAEMEQCKGRRWGFEVDGMRMRQVVQTTLGWVQKFMSVSGGTIGGALPWAGFRFLIQAAGGDQYGYDGLMGGLERVTWLASYCSAHERLYKDYFADNNKYSDLNNTFIEDLVHLYAAILKYLITVHSRYSKKNTARIVRASRGPSYSWAELERTIDDRKCRMDDYALLVHKSNVHQSLKDVLEIPKQTERQEFLNWISDIDYRGDHDANSRNILKGSGDWMLSGEEEFRSWKERGGVLWLCGIPGAGKTKLTSTIINHLTSTDENHTVAYFYCLRDANQPKKEDPEEILRAILKQLVILLPSRLSAPVMAKYKKEKYEGGDHGSIKSLTVKECMDFIVELATDRPVTIVIDALDECRENKRRSSQGSHTDRQDLLKELTAAKNSRISVFLSSRDDIDIQRRLHGCPTITLNASKNGSDILNFIKSEVDDIMERSDWGSDETLHEDIITAVNKRSNGMFRFAALQIGYLSGLDTRHGVRRRLLHLPATLCELYDEIYGRISAKIEEDYTVAKRALSWLLCARRQLPSSGLLAAVSPDSHQPVSEGELLRLCRHLVILNPVSKSFELAHLTVREYLETRQEYRDGRPHALVAERCIKVFDRDVSRCALDQYASLYWVHHYHSRPQTEENLLAGLVEKFFDNKGVNPVFEKWAKLTKDSSKALPWEDNIATRLRDAWYKPLGVVGVFGFAEVVHQWMDTEPGYSYFRDSDDLVVHLAIKWGNKDVVRLFLRHDMPAIDKFGWTSWVWAAVYKQLPVLEVLKELYGDANAQDSVGWTALHWMVFLGHLEGLKILLHMGAGPNMTDEAKWTPLHWARFLGRDAEAKELDVRGQGLNLEDDNGLTPFQWAEIVKDVLATWRISTVNRIRGSGQHQSAPLSQPRRYPYQHLDHSYLGGLVRVLFLGVTCYVVFSTV